jgi:arginyl-tRNA synthetase
MIAVQRKIRDMIHERIQDEFAIGKDEIVFSVPGDRRFGDLSTTAAFAIAKKTGEKPFGIGKRIVERLEGQFDFFEEIRLDGGGFVNFRFRKDFLFRYLVDNRDRTPEKKNLKVIVEHTSINPNKAAHIGHLRNSCLGDTLVRGFRFLGYDVEVQNYIDDTGIQIADVIWGLLRYQKKTLDEIGKIENLASYLWDLYAEVNRLFGVDPACVQQRNEVHKRIEENLDPEFSACRYVSEQVLRDHIRVMEILDIRYDLLVRESDIIALDLFNEAARGLTDRQVMYLSPDPEKKGCWVIRYEKENIEKIIIRSNGTITYVGKDIAYNFWKFGLLARDFSYQPFFSYPDSHPVYMTSSDPHPAVAVFAKAQRVYNVIDVRQSYLQGLIAQVLRDLGHDEQSRNFVHYAYEMVALTPRCVQELGFSLSLEEEKKTYVEVSGRKGIAVKADELIEKLVEKSAKEVQSRNPSMDEAGIQAIALTIAVGALRYFMIKFHLNSVIAFDFKDALNFEGDSGPYLQYTMVRTNSILIKLAADDRSPWGQIGSLDVLDNRELPPYWELILNLSQIELQVEYALENLDLCSLASFTYSLCQKFNHYYHLFPVISEPNSRVRSLRVALVLVFKSKLEKLLRTMGIPVPEKM